MLLVLEYTYIKKGRVYDVSEIVSFLDRELNSSGMGYVGSNQIRTECKKGTVWLAMVGEYIVGVRIGARTIYNLVVSKYFRGIGIGRLLVEIYTPEKVRVKALYVGHYGKKQREAFVDPRPFYEHLGFIFKGWVKAKNFFTGSNGTKRIHYKESDSEHIAIYVHPDPKQKRLFL